MDTFMVAPFTEGGRHPKTQARVRLFFDQFNPLSPFANGEQGASYEPWDLTTLYQDSAGTTPVTADGDPVGLMLDKSGNGNHASQSVAASRPIYRTDGVLHWLEFDGVDDYLRNTSVNFTATEFSVFVACMTNTPGVLSGIFKSGSAGLAGADKFVLVRTAGTSGVSDGTFRTANFAFSTGVPTIVEIHYSPTSIEFIQDGSVVSTLSGSFGGIPFTNDIVVGSSTDGIQRWNGDHYGSVFIDRNVSEPERQSTRQYLAQTAGVTL